MVTDYDIDDNDRPIPQREIKNAIEKVEYHLYGTKEEMEFIWKNRHTMKNARKEFRRVRIENETAQEDLHWWQSHLD